MKPTIPQLLQQGITAHREGQLVEAERLYRSILEEQIKHPDANHNLGVLKTSVNKVESALPLFKIALESKPSVEQFWLSYIDALIRLSMFNEAEMEVEKYKSTGHNPNKIEPIEARLKPGKIDQRVIFAVEDFYKGIQKKSILEASRGWIFTDSFDRHFMECRNPGIAPVNEKLWDGEARTALENQKVSEQFDAAEIIDKLNQETSITKKYEYLKKIIYANDLNLVNDSFKGKNVGDLLQAQEETFDSENLNLVVIGGGVCGLFLANSIKFLFGARANVLVLDNRSRKLNTREPFEREWLTQLPTHYFESYSPENLRSVIGCFGVNGYIGIPINVLETLLMLSCKDQGVKFYFSRNLQFSDLNNDVDLIFDATGGRLVECSYSSSASAEIGVRVPARAIDLRYAGVNQLYNIPHLETDSLDFVLKPHGDLHYPFVRNMKIYTHMVKITGLPANLINPLVKSAEELNSSNVFYIWTGCLREEINEGLIFINLLGEEYEFLTLIIKNPIKLKTLTKNYPEITENLNKNVLDFITILINSDQDNRMKIERPFSYDPYVNLSADSGRLYGKQVFPVGDSLFCGNPKMGNGLGSHLVLIGELLQRMVEGSQTERNMDGPNY